MNATSLKIKMPLKKINFDTAIYFVFFLAVLLRISHFGSIPEGHLVDEAGSAIDAYTILNYGTDRYGISYPVYFINYGGGQSALYPYSLAVCIWFLGFNPVAIRLPMLLGSIILGVFGLLAVGRILGNENPRKKKLAKLLFVMLYAFSPYPFMAAGVGLDCNLLLPMSTVFLYFMLKALDTSRAKDFAVAGISAGVMLYSYAISYLVLPIFLILSMSYLMALKRLSPKNFGAFFAPLTVIAFPLLLVQYVNYFDKPAMDFFGVTITKLPVYRASEITFDNIMQNMFLIVKSVLFYDWIDYNTVMRYWTFYPMSVLFFFRGLFCFGGNFIASLSERKFLGSVLIFFWLTAEFVVGSLLGKTDDTGANPNANKMNGIFFAIMFFTVTGIIASFSDMAKIKLKRYLAVFTAFLYLGFAISFFNYYFHEHKPKFCSDTICTDVIAYIHENEEFRGKKVWLDTYYPALLMSSTQFLTYPNLPLPLPPEQRTDCYEFASEKFNVSPGDLPKDTAYICHGNKPELIERYRAADFKILQFKHYVLIYKQSI